MLASVLAVAVIVAALWPAAALANGHALSAYLSFLPEVSNWGTLDATGEATVNVGEGRVEITARGLPPLATDVYEAWLVTAGLAQWVSVGRFAASGGPVEYIVEVDEIPDLDYRYLVITVEPAQGDTGEPSGTNAIAGSFANPEAVVLPTQGVAVATVAVSTGSASASAADATVTAEVAAEPGVPAPAYLPVSGAPVRMSTIVLALGLTALASGSLVLTPRR